MQTFLPCQSFQESAQALDNRRLNKQRVECLQIYNTLTHTSDGWQHHPAVKMWRNAEALLCLYAVKICEECDARGIADNKKLRERFLEAMLTHEFKIPFWWSEPTHKNKITHTHRCNLLRKDYIHYATVFPDVPVSEIFVTNYYWPVR